MTTTVFSRIDKCYHTDWRQHSDPLNYFTIHSIDGQAPPGVGPEKLIQIIAMCKVCINNKNFTAMCNDIPINGIRKIETCTGVKSVKEITKMEAIKLDALYSVMNG